MDLLLGIDGGGTKIKLVLTDLEGNLVHYFTKNVNMIDSVSLEETYELICEGLNQFFLESGTHGIISAFIGLSGITNEEDATNLAGLLRKNAWLSETKIVVRSDVFNAYKAGLEKDYGISIIIGTGIVAFSIEEKTKQEIRVGGYSFKEGDFGSSYDLGRRALKLLSKYFDKRIGASPLILELMDYFQIKTFNDMKDVLESLYENRTEVAQLAKIVTRHADSGDFNAIRIVEISVEEAVLHIKAILKQIELNNLEISVTGGLGNADTLYKTLFYQKILEIDPRFYIHPNLLHPCCGSIIIAMEQIGIDSKKYLNHLKTIKF